MTAKAALIAAIILVAMTAWMDKGAAEMLFPVKKSVVEGYRIAYREAGEGPPVILIHGLAASSVYWRDTMGPLAETRRVYAVDLLGFGDSDKPSVDYSIEGYVEQVAAFMQDRGLVRADIVGHSLGGTVAALFAAEYPWKVRRLVLVDLGGLIPGRIGWLARMSGAPVIGSILMHLRTRGMVRHVLRTKVLLNPDLATDDLVEPIMRSSPRAYARLFRDVRTADIRPALRRLTMPTLVLWGERDKLFPTAAGIEAAKLAAEGRYTAVPNAAHIPQIENPKAFNEMLNQFLSEP